MNLKLYILVGAALASAPSAKIWAQPAAPHAPLGAKKSIDSFIDIEVKNFQDKSLGRIVDLGIDLVNGRVVEVLVKSDDSLDVANKIVAVPPGALLPDPDKEVYRLNMSADVFKTAAAIDVTKWSDSGRNERVAAAYHLFAQEPYFLEEGAPAAKTAEGPKVSLGYVERSSKILFLPVANLQNEQFGKVWSMTMDIPKGRILSVIILAPGNLKTKSVVPAVALSFNDGRDGLVLDDSKVEFEDEPRYVFTKAAYGQPAYSQEEPYKGPHTAVALEQGGSYRDIDRTVRIYKDIRIARINGRNVQIGTVNGRVTLRGWVHSDDDKVRIGAVAIAASRVELVDNQITVGRPVSIN